MSSDSELIKNQNSSALPIITFDLDGVLCNPIFGQNLGINNSPLDPEAESVPANIPPIWLRLLWDTIRFELRRPISGTVQVLTQLQANYSLILVTGRRTSPGSWMRRHGIEKYFDAIIWNSTLDKSPHYKLLTLNRIQPLAHIEDDPRTADLLAYYGHRVILRDWPSSRTAKIHSSVQRIPTLQSLLDRSEDLLSSCHDSSYS